MPCKKVMQLDAEWDFVFLCFFFLSFFNCHLFISLDFLLILLFYFCVCPVCIIAHIMSLKSVRVIGCHNAASAGFKPFLVDVCLIAV